MPAASCPGREQKKTYLPGCDGAVKVTVPCLPLEGQLDALRQATGHKVMRLVEHPSTEPEVSCSPSWITVRR